MNSRKSFPRSYVVVPLASAALLWTGAVGRLDFPATGPHRSAARIQGTVTFSGNVPAGETVDMSNDSFCVAAQDTPPIRRPIDTDGQGRVRDVLVYVRSGHESASFGAPESDALLDQASCRYRPHVVALQVGQTLTIRNRDATLHNVHVFAEANRGFNIGQPLPGVEARRTFESPEMAIRVRCDIHGWMGGIIAVFDHPFFAVTGADGGFSLDGLPPGDYVVEAWHETLGTQVQTVSVPAEGSAEIAIVFDAL